MGPPGPQRNNWGLAQGPGAWGRTAEAMPGAPAAHRMCQESLRPVRLRPSGMCAQRPFPEPPPPTPRHRAAGGSAERWAPTWMFGELLSPWVWPGTRPLGAPVGTMVGWGCSPNRGLTPPWPQQAGISGPQVPALTGGGNYLPFGGRGEGLINDLSAAAFLALSWGSSHVPHIGGGRTPWGRTWGSQDPAPGWLGWATLAAPGAAQRPRREGADGPGLVLQVGWCPWVQSRPPTLTGVV